MTRRTLTLLEPIDADERPDPLAEPVVPVPPVPPLDSCSPTVRFTWDTVPSNVATSDAPANACCAFVNVSFAEVTFVSSAAICASDAPAAWSSASFASASATVDCAELTPACNCAESIVASTSPVVTASPTLTFTAVTVPDDGKLRSSVCSAATVPSDDTLWLIEPRVTVATVCVVAAAGVDDPPPERKPNHHTENAITSTIGTITRGRTKRRIPPEPGTSPEGDDAPVLSCVSPSAPPLASMSGGGDAGGSGEDAAGSELIADRSTWVLGPPSGASGP